MNASRKFSMLASLAGLATCGLVFFFAPLDAAAINADPATNCEWPSVVHLRDRDGTSLCTGVYIGGRVVLTASHCADELGFHLRWSDLIDYVGLAPVTNTGCSDNSDCPAVQIFGQLEQLECVSTSCDFDDMTDSFSNFTFEGWFGENRDEHPYNTIPIQYCRIAEEPDDFAYCILTQEPDVQPVPMIMPCEVDEFLDGTNNLDVAFVGCSGGTKRWESATAYVNILSSDDTITYSPTLGLSPGEGGDSGGGLFVKLPDGTWRLLGINVTTQSSEPPWQFVDFLLEDPEVDASALFPCQDEMGAWAPSANCGGFPASPDTGSGQWARGPLACHDTDVGSLSETCGDPWMPNIPLPPSTPVTGPATPSTAERTSGCSATDAPPALGVGLLALVLGLRRRISRLALFCGLSLLVPLAACQDDSPATEADDEVGDTGDAAEPFEINPNLSHATSGIIFTGVNYDDIAVGNVARTISSSSCCLDYVVAGPDSANARIVFGGGSTTNGLTFLDDEADQEIAMADMGEAIDDIVLVDVNNDGKHDLVSLTTNSEIHVRLGNASVMTPFGSATQYSAVEGGAYGRGRIATGFLDCGSGAAYADIVVTAPDQDAVVILHNDGSGGFPSGGREKLDVGEGPQDVAVGDLDGNAREDIVTVNNDVTISINAAMCDRERDATTQEFEDFLAYWQIDPEAESCAELDPGLNCIDDSSGAAINVTPSICGVDYGDVVVTFADRVDLFCNDGSGGFPPDVNDPWQYQWDLNQGQDASLMQANPAHSFHVWDVPGEDPQLFVANTNDTDALVQLSLTALAYGEDHLPVARLGNEGPIHELVLSSHTGGGSDWWQRIAFVGDRTYLGSDGAMGFAR